MGVAPSHAVMGRVGMETIPHHPTWLPKEINPQVTQSRRKKTNDHASRKRRAKVSDLREGDQVLLKDRYPGSKFRLPFEAEPWRVVRRQGTMITASQGDESVTRNVSFFKRYHMPIRRHDEQSAEWGEEFDHLESRMSTQAQSDVRNFPIMDRLTPGGTVEASQGNQSHQPLEEIASPPRSRATLSQSDLREIPDHLHGCETMR